MNASANMDQALSVSELTGHIKAVLEETFPPVWVAAEIGDLSRPRSGHIYLTLKDDDAQIRGIIWRSTASRLKFELRDGQAVLCYGQLEVYAARGTYQLVIRKIEPQGIGALQLAFQQLRGKLDGEGLFAAERKRTLPAFPRRLAVVTSPSGAAIRDFLRAASERWQGVEITVVPAVVQGAGGVASIVSAIAAAQRLDPRPDVLLLTRGGGSLEDLWCFNEEAVVRAVARSEIPTVSAVGHEVDITLCDLVADIRALTPTDGACKILPERTSVERSVRQSSQRLNRAMRLAIESRRARLEAICQRTVIRKPHELIQLRTRRLDEWDARARRAMFGQLQACRGRLATAAAALSALSPLDVLARGYSVTLDENGQAIGDVDQIDTGQRLTTRLARGWFESTVDRRGEPTNDVQE